MQNAHALTRHALRCRYILLMMLIFAFTPLSLHMLLLDARRRHC